MTQPPEHLIQFALEASFQSPCQSKRGVVIFEGDKLVSVGHNYQPQPFICDGTEQCKMSCGKTAVHAEQHALLFAGRSVRGCVMLHVKSSGGQLAESMGPSCIYCSKLMVAAGITGMWLYHHSGWRWYQINEFHWLSAGSPRVHLALASGNTGEMETPGRGRSGGTDA